MTKWMSRAQCVSNSPHPLSLAAAERMAAPAASRSLIHSCEMCTRCWETFLLGRTGCPPLSSGTYATADVVVALIYYHPYYKSDGVDKAYPIASGAPTTSPSHGDTSSVHGESPRVIPEKRYVLFHPRVHQP